MSDKQIIVNNNLREFFKLMGKRHINSIAINTGNTEEHERKKAEVAISMMFQGHTIATELVTKKGYRPDVVLLDVYPAMCIEIVKSEKQESIDKKIIKYSPMQLMVVKA